MQLVSQACGCTQRLAAKAVDSLFAGMRQGLIDGDRIEIRGFGAFQVRNTLPKPGARSPRTGEAISVPARRKTPSNRVGFYGRRCLDLWRPTGLSLDRLCGTLWRDLSVLRDSKQKPAPHGLVRVHRPAPPFPLTQADPNPGLQNRAHSMNVLLDSPAHGLGVFYLLVTLQAVLGGLFAARRIGPNSFLGIRTPKTLSSPVAWFQAHSYWGRSQLVCASVSFVGLLLLSGVDGPRAVPLALLVIGIPTALSVVGLWVYLARL